jgi:hypothetical protein
LREIRLAALDGHQRRFNFQTSMARGTVEQPALMLSLEARVGCCQGLAIHLAAERAEAELEILWRREMIRGAYRPVMLPVATPQGDISALVFTSNPAHPEYVGELPLPDTAAIIAGLRCDGHESRLPGADGAATRGAGHPRRLRGPARVEGAGNPRRLTARQFRLDPHADGPFTAWVLPQAALPRLPPAQRRSCPSGPL